MNAEQKIIKKFANDCLATIKAGEGLCFREQFKNLEHLPVLLRQLEEIEMLVTDWCRNGILGVMHDWGIDEKEGDE